jgi:hypothetical protein
MSIRQETFKHYTIINSFKDSGMWPLSYKQGIKKVWLYKKSNSNKRTIDDVNEQEDDLEFSRLLLSRLIEIWNIVAKVREFTDRDPTKFLDNSREVFKDIMKTVNLQL